MNGDVFFLNEKFVCGYLSYPLVFALIPYLHRLLPHHLHLRVLSSTSIHPPFCLFPLYFVRDSTRILSIIGRNPPHHFPPRSGNQSSASSGDNSSYPIILSPTIFHSVILLPKFVSSALLLISPHPLFNII